MTAMQFACRRDRLRRGAEHHGQSDVERPLEPADWIAQAPGMLGDRSGYPRVSQLQQQCVAGSKKDRRFSVEAPRDRFRAKYARRLARGGGPDHRQLALEIGLTNNG
jgi:hypothetical protein